LCGVALVGGERLQCSFTEGSAGVNLPTRRANRIKSLRGRARLSQSELAGRALLQVRDRRRGVTDRSTGDRPREDHGSPGRDPSPDALLARAIERRDRTADRWKVDGEGE